MDPITQGALGAALPQATAVTRKGAVALAGCFGFIAGMAADLDWLIRSVEDPLLFLEYHRQFSHSLVFIPLGGLISALILHGLIGRRSRLGFSRTLLYCTLGYGTHGLLDFMTSYGTMLLWPFSEERYAANIIAIIDPLLSVPIVLLVVVATIRKSPLCARMALGWVALYLTAGAFQHHAAKRMAEQNATARGHAIERLTVKPTFGNILVWKSVYETDARFYIDGLRVGFAPRVFPGPSIARLDWARDFPWLDPASQQFRDLARFNRHSQGYAARSPDAPNTVIDVRYSFLPHKIGALWSIALTPEGGPDRHVRFQTNRGNARANLATLWRLAMADRKK